MTASALVRMVGRDLGRTRGPLLTAGFGIALGVAALVFFLALGFGARRVLLGELFPIDQVELEPKRTSAGLLSLLAGRHEPPTVSREFIELVKTQPGVVEVYPKLRFRFPSTARGGKELLGREIGTHEMVGDGIDPALVAQEPGLEGFVDPLAKGGGACKNDADCAVADYCERPSDQARGQCSGPVPALVSRYLVELFDHAVAPAHGLPPVAETLLRRAEGVTFQMTLGDSLLGKAHQGQPRPVKVRFVGVSPKAIDLGATLPLSVVRRWNREYAGGAAADSYSSIVVRLQDASYTSRIIQLGNERGLVPRDSKARDVSVLISGVLALLVLVATVILVVAALNIAHTLRVLVAERQREIGLYRALGATAADMRTWILCLALLVGALAGAGGALAARLAAGLADWRAAVDLPDFPFKPDTFFAFPWWLWLLAVAFACLFALLGALGPAHKAARTDPAVALSRAS
jgi:putative ABC transport system permease protein